MAKLVFHLSNVPDDEAELVRQALTEANVDYFETDAGRWRVGVAAIWVHSSDDVLPARRAIEAVQANLPKHTPPPLWYYVALNPLRSVAVIALIAGVVAVTFIPMWMLIN